MITSKSNLQQCSENSTGKSQQQIFPVKFRSAEFSFVGRGVVFLLLSKIDDQNTWNDLMLQWPIEQFKNLIYQYTD